MKSKLVTFLVVAVSFLMVSGPMSAHHGSAAYDTAKSITVKGTVTDFQFVNPHVIVYFDVKDDKGNVQQWQCELTSPNHLARIGWSRNSLKPGEQITVTGYPAKTGANSLWIRKLVLPNGQEYGAGGE